MCGIRGGVVVGAHGEGFLNRRIPERGGVRCDLVHSLKNRSSTNGVLL